MKQADIKCGISKVFLKRHCRIDCSGTIRFSVVTRHYIPTLKEVYIVYITYYTVYKIKYILNSVRDCPLKFYFDYSGADVLEQL